MTVTVTRPAINLREELNSLRNQEGTTGSQLLAADTVSDVYRIIGNNGFKNLIHNGDFKIAQRGTSLSFTGGQAGIDGTHGLDRWHNGYYYNGGSFSPAWTISQQIDHPLGNGMCMQIYTDTGANPGTAGLNQLSIQQSFEAKDVFHTGGPNAQPMTLSFWVKSNKPGVYGVQIRMRTSGSNPIIIKRYQILQSGVWEYKTITFPAQTLVAISNSTGSGTTTGGFISFTLSGAWNKNADSGMAGAEDAWIQYNSNAICFVDQTNLVQTAGNYLKITDVQYEIGSTATPFERRPTQTELALCQRYAYVISGPNAGDRLGSAFIFSSTGGIITLPHPVLMRSAPSLSGTASAITLNDSIAGYNQSTAVTINSANSNFTALSFTSSGMTAGRGAQAYFTNTASNNYIALSAEIIY
jgi:hypothetical protein